MEIIIQRKSNFSIGLRELWQYRELLYYFTVRDIKVKYQATTLGILWVVLQPLALAGIFVLVFSKGLKIKTNSLPYPVFVLTGLVLWGYVASCMTNAAHSMELNARIVRKIYFPRLIIPLSSVTASAFDLVFGIVIVALGCVVYSVDFQWINFIVSLILSLSLLTLAATGLACLFAILNAIYKDFRYVIPFVVQLLFFGSSVFYEADQLIVGWWAALFDWNPFAVGIDIFRDGLVGQSSNWLTILKGFLVAFCLFAFGLFVFKIKEAELADTL